MNATEFDRFLEQCYKEFEQKQYYFTTEFEIRQYEEFTIDLRQGTLEFQEDNQVKLRAKITPIGSYSALNSNWLWAWGYPSLPDGIQQKSEQIKELGRITGMKIFDTTIFPADEERVWEITAMACHYLKAMGCYRVPVGNIWVFVAVDEVKIFD
jgi:hypothetical protein